MNRYVLFGLLLFASCAEQQPSPHAMGARPELTRVMARVPTPAATCSLAAAPQGVYRYQFELLFSLSSGDEQRNGTYTQPETNSCGQWLSDPASIRGERALQGDGLTPGDNPPPPSFAQTVQYQNSSGATLAGTTECTTGPDIVRVTVRAGSFDALLTTCRAERSDYYMPRTVRTWQHPTTRVVLRREITWRISRWESSINHELIEAPPGLTRSGAAPST